MPGVPSSRNAITVAGQTAGWRFRYLSGPSARGCVTTKNAVASSPGATGKPGERDRENDENSVANERSWAKRLAGTETAGVDIFPDRIRVRHQREEASKECRRGDRDDSQKNAREQCQAPAARVRGRFPCFRSTESGRIQRGARCAPSRHPAAPGTLDIPFLVKRGVSSVKPRRPRQGVFGSNPALNAC